MAVGFVRPARPDDAGDIARIQLVTWRTAYRRLMPRHVLAGLSADWLHERWLAAVQDPPSPQHRVLVATERTEQTQTQDYVTGFAASGPADENHFAEPGDAGLDVAAITELLVEPRWGRRGHGSRLLAACVDMWRQDRRTQAVYWVFEQDASTRSLLTSAGWAPDGATRQLDVDDLLVPQLRLHCAL